MPTGRRVLIELCHSWITKNFRRYCTILQISYLRQFNNLGLRDSLLRLGLLPGLLGEVAGAPTLEAIVPEQPVLQDLP
jgi:hypothetical protein